MIQTMKSNLNEITIKLNLIDSEGIVLQNSEMCMPIRFVDKRLILEIGNNIYEIDKFGSILKQINFNVPKYFECRYFKHQNLIKEIFKSNNIENCKKEFKIKYPKKQLLEIIPLI